VKLPSRATSTNTSMQRSRSTLYSLFLAEVSEIETVNLPNRGLAGWNSRTKLHAKKQ
jgi:hypothetical protein